MRLYFSAGIGASEAAEWIVENKVLRSSLARSPALAADTLSRIEEVTITNEDGNQIDAVKLSIDRARAERFVIRVAKGLTCHYFPAFDRFTSHWRAVFVGTRLDDIARVEPLRERLPFYDFRGDGVIKYRYGHTNGLEAGVWMLLFYDVALFLVQHSIGPYEGSQK